MTNEGNQDYIFEFRTQPIVDLEPPRLEAYNDQVENLLASIERTRQMLVDFESTITDLAVRIEEEINKISDLLYESENVEPAIARKHATKIRSNLRDAAKIIEPFVYRDYINCDFISKDPEMSKLVTMLSWAVVSAKVTKACLDNNQDKPHFSVVGLSEKKTKILVKQGVISK